MRRTLPIIALFALAGCSSWMGDSEEAGLPGERLPVLAYDQQLTADPALANAPLGLPESFGNSDWATVGGSATHSGGSFSMESTTLKDVWSHDMGAGVDADNPLLSSPIIVAGTVYTLDSEGQITSTDGEHGKELWQKDLSPSRTRDEAAGGGLAYAGNNIYAALGYGEMVALNLSGEELWRTSTRSPLRSAPTADESTVYVVTIDNQLIALDAATGAIKWTHSGIMEAAGLLGAPAPLIGPDYVLVAYSSGELYALRPTNGREIWSENLAGARREGGVMSIAAIRGMPALSPDGRLAVAISNSGKMVAIDTRSGQRVWDQRMGGNQMPWIAGDTVFVVNNMAQLVALNLRDGRLRWVQQLAQWKEPDISYGLIAWYGPIMAGGKLWMTNSLGRMIAFDPTNGAELQVEKIGSPTNRPPIVAMATLYTLDDDADLTAWR